jgi:hypothetical protein
LENKAKRTYKPRAKKAASKPRKKRQPKAPVANLPEPIDIAAARPAPEPKTEGNLLSGLGSLFQPQPSSTESGILLNGSPVDSSHPEDPLPPESERILAGVPETIGDDQGDAAPGPVEVPDADPIAALMAQVAFEPQDVQDVIEEFFDWMAERFQSDHWKLTERQSRMLGRPAAQLANSLWQKMQSYVPDILSKWCEETPGAMAFIVACGIVVVPKVSTQLALSRERAKAQAPNVPKPQPISAAVPNVPKSVPRVNWQPEGEKTN